MFTLISTSCCHYLDGKEYENKLKLAISQLKVELGQNIVYSLPHIAWDTLMKERRTILHNKWKQMNKSCYGRNMWIAEEKADKMLREFGEVKDDTIGNIIAYKIIKTINVGFQEDSLILKHPKLLLDNKIFSFPKQTVNNMTRIIKKIVDDPKVLRKKKDLQNIMLISRNIVMVDQ